MRIAQLCLSSDLPAEAVCTPPNLAFRAVAIEKPANSSGLIVRPTSTCEPHALVVRMGKEE